MKPASHSGWIVIGSSPIGLSTGTTSGKAYERFSDKPKFIGGLMATIIPKPSEVKCSFRLMRRTIFFSE